MSRRQSYPEPSTTQQSLLQQIKDLKHEIQLKNTQIQDLKFQLNTLKKQQSIWYHLDESYQKSNIQQQRKNLLAENQKFKSQILNMLVEIQRKGQIIGELNQKINDLKEYNLELKRLSEKAEVIHQKELEFMQSALFQNQYINNSHNYQPNYNHNQVYNQQLQQQGMNMNMNMSMIMNMNILSQLQKLRSQKQKLQQALSQCGIISKQMQDYYMQQIQNSKKLLQQQKIVVQRLQTNKNKLQHQLKRRQLQLQQIKNKYAGVMRNNRQSQGRDKDKQRQKQKQNQINQLIKSKNMQKKWEIIVNQIRQRYQKQISQLKDQIRFLVVKIESMQDAKSSYDNVGLASSILTQSKMGMSASSNQSFRFTANNSFSSSIKQSLSRRQTGIKKTPSKSSRQSNNLSYLLDRTNL